MDFFSHVGAGGEKPLLNNSNRVISIEFSRRREFRNFGHNDFDRVS